MTRSARSHRISGLVVCTVVALTACGRSAAELDASADPGASSTPEQVATWERYVIVLPFKNQGGPEEDALVAGLTQEVRKRIAALASVSVISADQVGLNVLNDVGLRRPDIERTFDLILDGSILWAGEGVETEIRIVERGWEPGVWNSRWTTQRNVDGLLTTQSEMATEVRRILELPDPDVESPKRTHSIEAYEAYLRGLSADPTAPAPAIEASIASLERAVRLDSSFALAHARLSERRSELSHLETERSAEHRAQAKVAAERALRLEPSLPEGHRALGLYHLAGGDPERALEELTAASLEMPEDVETLTALGRAHLARGDLESCQARYRQAFRLSPSGDLASRLGAVVQRLGDGEGARRWFDYAARLGHRE